MFAPEIPALPTGYTGIPRQLVEASQRQRLLHGVTTAVARKGFAATTIADIADRAGVSKKTFYEIFADKTECFLAAYDHGNAAVLAQTTAASTTARDAGLPAIDQLRAGTGAYLDALVVEAPYARTFCLEMLAAGPEAIARHRASRETFAQRLQAWHEAGRADHPHWPAAGPLAFEAATGIVYELSSARVATGRVDELPALKDELVALQLALLRIPHE